MLRALWVRCKTLDVAINKHELIEVGIKGQTEQKVRGWRKLVSAVYS